ncbi:MAG: hypothetical protein IT180_17740 [Acidobacteria bacterium]|nr:hypothetical protein [Acidobacteriota bacterium]
MPAEHLLHEAFQAFLHDLRTPLSVAQGYLRLIRERRLVEESAREEALAQTVKSLSRLDRLCAEAAAFLAAQGTAPADTSMVPASRIVEALYTGLAAHGIAVAGQVATAGADQLVAAMLQLIDWSSGQVATTTSVARLERHDGWLRLLTGSPEQQQALRSEEPVAIERWRGGAGLRLATACLDVERHGGRVWTTGAARPALGVALPLQATAP